MKDIALPTINIDRALKTDLKIDGRDIKPVDERVADRSDPASQVVKDYATALRAVLLEDDLGIWKPIGNDRPCGYAFAVTEKTVS